MNLGLGSEFRSCRVRDCTEIAGRMRWDAACGTLSSLLTTHGLFFNSDQKKPKENLLCFLKTSAKVLMGESLSYRKREIPKI